MAIKYIKKYAGLIYYVKEIQIRKKRLVAKTMYKKTARGLSTAESSLWHTSKTSPDSINNIANNGEEFNENNQIEQKKKDNDPDVNSTG